MEKTLSFIAVSAAALGVLITAPACSFNVINSQSCTEWEPGICRERSDDLAISDEDAPAFEAECADRGGELKPFPGQCTRDENSNTVETVGRCEYTLEDDVETFVDFYFEPWTEREAEEHCTGTWVAAE